MNDLDDPNVYDGAPVGLQLMGRRFDEERMMGVASLVVDALAAMSGLQVDKATGP